MTMQMTQKTEHTFGKLARGWRPSLYSGIRFCDLIALTFDSVNLQNCKRSISDWQTAMHQGLSARVRLYQWVLELWIWQIDGAFWVLQIALMI